MSKIEKLHPHSGRYMDEGDKVRNIIDRVTGAITGITSDHNNIHKHTGFCVSGIFANVGNSTTVNYCFKTPTVESELVVHFKYRELQSSNNKVRVDFYEAPTNAPVNGTDLTPHDRHRHGTIRESQMQAFKAGATIDLTGATMLDTSQYISGHPRSLDIEWVLKPDTWYIVTLTNATGGATDISFFDFWYEEDINY